jgi:hypothetical protein
MTVIQYTNRIIIDEMPVESDGNTLWHKVAIFTGVTRSAVAQRGFNSSGDAIVAMKQWCSENTNHKWSSYITVFYFEDELDATLFTLRWS